MSLPPPLLDPPLSVIISILFTNFYQNIQEVVVIYISGLIKVINTIVELGNHLECISRECNTVSGLTDSGSDCHQVSHLTLMLVIRFTLRQQLHIGV